MINTVSILEDSKMFIDFVREDLANTTDLTLANVANNCAEAASLFVENPSTIYLIDIQLPDGNGIDIIKKIKPLQQDAKFIVCTAFDDDENVFEALKSGANGYIVKTDNNIDIIKAIHECINGGAPMSSEIASKVLNFFYNLQQKNALIESLTDKEHLVLEHLSKGYLYKEIANNINCSMDVVKKMCGTIYRKLRVNNKIEAVNLYLGR